MPCRCRTWVEVRAVWFHPTTAGEPVGLLRSCRRRLTANVCHPHRGMRQPERESTVPARMNAALLCTKNPCQKEPVSCAQLHVMLKPKVRLSSRIPRGYALAQKATMYVILFWQTWEQQELCVWFAVESNRVAGATEHGGRLPSRMSEPGDCGVPTCAGSA